jgi:uncharacterized protein (DUF2062 family)
MILQVPTGGGVQGIDQQHDPRACPGACRKVKSQAEGTIGVLPLPAYAGPMRALLRKKLWDPAERLLRQGATPEALATAVAAGAVISVCPLIGLPTPLCAFVALRWRLNLVLIQGVNYLCAGLQWLLLIPFLRAGEWLFKAPRFPLAVAELRARLAEDFWATALAFWGSALYGLVVWALLAGPAAWALRRAALPAFRRLRPAGQ